MHRRRDVDLEQLSEQARRGGGGKMPGSKLLGQIFCPLDDLVECACLHMLFARLHLMV